MERKSGRPRMEKKNGQKWVEGNFDAKVKARGKDGELPYTHALETSDHHLSRDWSAENLPEILFYLTPPPSQYQGETVQHLRDEDTGEIILSEEGNEIKDFEILPRYISVEVEGWMVEAWRRIDTRITYQDILDRQRSDPDFGGVGIKKLSKNALQNHCYRDCRKVLNNWIEYGRRDEPHRTEVENIEELSYTQIAYNTVLRESSEFKGRLVRVALKQHTKDGLYHAEPVEVTPANVRRTTFDLWQFIEAAPPPLSPDNYMTVSMDAAWQMSILLMERARMHGKQHWSKLGRQCLPVTWFDRLGKDKKTVPNPTYDGGCTVCTWYEGRDEGFTTYDRDFEVSLASRKRGRAASGSNSDEPLMKKRRRVRAAKDDLDSDNESEVETEIDNRSLRARRCTSPASSNAFTTPEKPRQSSSALATDEEEYDAGMEDYDDDATEVLLSSGRQSIWSSGGRPNPRYQQSPSCISMIESSKTKCSSSLHYTSDSVSHLADIKCIAITRPQPQWQEVGITESATYWPYELSYPNPTQPSGLTNYQGQQGRGYVSFTASNLDPSFSAGEWDAETAATSFASGNEMTGLPYALQAANVKMQCMLDYVPPMNVYAHQMPLYYPGRYTTQGERLTDILSSPVHRATKDFDMAPDTYQSNSSMIDGNFSRRHSFADDPPAHLSKNAYGQSLATDMQWRSGHLYHDDEHCAMEGINQFLEDDYNELREPLASPTPPESANTGFLDLLSSDPTMPEEYQDLIGTDMSEKAGRFEASLEHDTVVPGIISDQDFLHGVRETPPLLDC